MRRAYLRYPPSPFRGRKREQTTTTVDQCEKLASCGGHDADPQKKDAPNKFKELYEITHRCCPSLGQVCQNFDTEQSIIAGSAYRWDRQKYPPVNALLRHARIPPKLI